VTQGQPGQTVQEILSQKYPTQKKGSSGSTVSNMCEALNSNHPGTAKMCVCVCVCVCVCLCMIA
jgi:hypothetical protein